MRYSTVVLKELPSLRRHEDNEPLFDDEGSNVSRGNFKELIKDIPEFDSEIQVYI